MLFDLQSPRRRNFIRVVYAMLALLMGGGLILFGIGGGGNGGILDAIGLGGNGSSSGGGFGDQIDSAEKRAQANPKDPTAQLALATIYVQAAKSEYDVDEQTGQASPTPDAADDLEKAADAWAAYLKTDPKKPSAGVAIQVAQGYFALAQLSTSYPQAQNNLESAAKAQDIAIKSLPSFGSYATLAQYEYLAGDTAAGDAAVGQAKKDATPSQSSSLDQFVTQLKQLSASFQKQAKQEQAQQGSQGAGASPSAGSNPFENPLGQSGGGLGSSSLGGP